MRARLTVASLATLLLFQATAQNTNRWTQPACSDGGRDYVIFSNPNSGCLCELKGRAPAGYVECPGPKNGDAFGFSVCNPRPDNSSSSCAVQCYQDAELNAQGECRSINIAPGIPDKISYLSECEEPVQGEASSSPFLIAKPGGGCACDRKRPAPVGQYCEGPPNSVVFCVSDEKGIAPGRCDFTCKDPNMKKDGALCVAKPVTGPGPGTGGPGPTDPHYPVVAKACESHVPFMFAYADNTCACYDTLEDGSPGKACSNPVGGHGVGSCRDTSATSSECFIQCDHNYKLEGDRCVLDKVEAIFYNKDCSRNPPGRYLTADPRLGCVCMPTQSPQWCQTPTGGGRASCFQSATVVECRPSCPAGKKFEAPNACILDCASGFKPVGDVCVLACGPGTVAQNGVCVPIIITKLSSECNPGEVLNASPSGCRCESAASRTSCWPPKTVSAGKGRCTSNFDGTGAVCSLECNAPLRPNAREDECV